MDDESPAGLTPHRTLQDPAVDVDLHIREQGGHHVYYSSRESENGGFLYYDITDGFGPKICTLGQGPKGVYHLSVVYYSGATQNVKGTVTVLRNAGSPEETREHLPFVLERSNTEREIPIGKFVL